MRFFSRPTRFPWANANRVADDHARDVSSIEAEGFEMASHKARLGVAGAALADRLDAVFPDGMFYGDGMQNPPEYLGTWRRGKFVPDGNEIAPLQGPFSPAELDAFRQAIVDGDFGFVISLESPRPWRWYRDAAVWGLIAAALVIVGPGYWMTGP